MRELVQERIDFFKSFPFFEKMPNNKILSLIPDKEFKKYQNKNVIYNINDRVDKIYFLMKGQVEIL